MSSPAFPGRLRAGDPELSERQRDVFAALVSLHGRAARAVGSERLAQESALRMGSATVRAVLGELEDLGLLERGRGSSARVPSSHGYEFFVRALLEPAVLPPHVLAAIDAQLSQSTSDVESLFHEASRLLASVTCQLGLALATSLDEERLVGLDLEPLGERRAMLVLGLAGHSTRTLLLELDTPLERGDLDSVQGVLRERLLGHVLGEVRARLGQDPALARTTALRIVARAAAAGWTRTAQTPLLSAGARHMAGQPEFAGEGAGVLGTVLQVLETGDPLNRLMVSGIEGQVGVRVGVDSTHALAACSLVSFPLPGAFPGAVGVLGPRRMDYAFTLAVVDRVGTRVADLLSA